VIAGEIAQQNTKWRGSVSENTIRIILTPGQMIYGEPGSLLSYLIKTF
jgi:hypothetical protein